MIALLSSPVSERLLTTMISTTSSDAPNTEADLLPDAIGDRPVSPITSAVWGKATALAHRSLRSRAGCSST